MQQDEKVATDFVWRCFLKKQYVFLPIDVDDHWSLVIICRPGGNDPQTGMLNCLLHLDSLEVTHKSEVFFAIICNILKEVWRIQLGGDFREEDFQLPTKRVAILRQENYSDCGVFVLYSIQKFLDMAPKPYTHINFMEDNRMVSNPWILNQWGILFQERVVCLLIF
jgi:Ulp1 family protease